RDTVMGVLRDHFRPEFLNRVDEVIVFRALTEEQIAAIVDIQLQRLERRLADRRVSLVVTEEARKLLAQRGWDPVYGARPLKRAIQRMVQDPLAMMLLEGKFSEGDSVEAGAKGGELTFSKAKTPVASRAG
ncbi:MAG: ATP-dependent chaperone ClpB, partial [Hyphomicrobiales bacterium]